MSFSVTKSRSMQQAGANTETEQCEVKKTYQDAQGNVSHADVQRPGINKLLPHVPNSSGIRLIKGMPVTVNWRQGSRYAPHITGAAGSAGGALVQSAVGSGSSSGGTETTTGTDYSSTAFLVAQPDEDLPLGLTMQEGANVVFEDTPPTDPGDGSGPVGGDRFIHARPRVEIDALPDPSGLLDGTLVDLTDDDPGSPTSLGMYRLWNGQWIRRDVGGSGGGGGGGGGGGSDVTTADRNRWDTAGTNASQALTTATAAQSTADTVSAEVADARSRYAIAGSFGAYTYANLKNHLNALWTALAKRTADPNGVTAGWTLQADGNGAMVLAAPTAAPTAATYAPPAASATRVTGNLTITPSDNAEAWYVVYAGAAGSNVEIVVNAGTNASGKKLHFINGVQGQFANTLQITATQGSAPSSANIVVVSTDGGDCISLEIVTYPGLPAVVGSVETGSEPPPGTPMTSVQERVQVLNVFRAAGLNADIEAGDKTLTSEGGVITGVQTT